MPEPQNDALYESQLRPYQPRVLRLKKLAYIASKPRADKLKQAAWAALLIYEANFLNAEIKRDVSAPLNTLRFRIARFIQADLAFVQKRVETCKTFLTTCLEINATKLGAATQPADQASLQGDELQQNPLLEICKELQQRVTAAARQLVPGQHTVLPNMEAAYAALLVYGHEWLIRPWSRESFPQNLILEIEKKPAELWVENLMQNGVETLRSSVAQSHELLKAWHGRRAQDPALVKTKKWALGKARKFRISLAAKRRYLAAAALVATVVGGVAIVGHINHSSTGADLAMQQGVSVSVSQPANLDSAPAVKPAVTLKLAQDAANRIPSVKAPAPAVTPLTINDYTFAAPAAIAGAAQTTDVSFTLRMAPPNFVAVAPPAPPVPPAPPAPQVDPRAFAALATADLPVGLSKLPKVETLPVMRMATADFVAAVARTPKLATTQPATASATGCDGLLNGVLPAIARRITVTSCSANGQVNFIYRSTVGPMAISAKLEKAPGAGASTKQLGESFKVTLAIGNKANATRNVIVAPVYASDARLTGVSSWLPRSTEQQLQQAGILYPSRAATQMLARAMPGLTAVAAR